MAVTETRTYEWPGRWRLAGSAPDEALTGTLRVPHAYAMTLELMGVFGGATDYHPAGDDPVLVHGITTKGTLMTVEVVDEASTHFSAFGERKTYRLRRMIEGRLLDSLDPVVSSIEFGISRLHDWAQLEAFSDKHEWTAFPAGARFTLDYVEPHPLTLARSGDFVVHLMSSTALPFVRKRSRSACLHRDSHFRIDSGARRPLSDYLPLVGQLRSLLSFATAVPNSVTFLDAYENKTEDKPFPLQLDRQQSLRLYPVDDILPDSTESELPPHRMLFTLRDDEADIFPVTSRWLSSWNDIGAIVSLFLSATQTRDVHEEHRFLSLITALEGLHRLTHSNELIPLAKHRARKAIILKSIPKACRTLVANSLQHSNEPSLRVRLTAMLDQALAIVPDFMGDRERFIARTVYTRNYLGHVVAGLRPETATGVALYHISRILITTMEVALLLWLGFSRDNVKALVEPARHLRNTPEYVRFALEDRWGSI